MNIRFFGGILIVNLLISFTCSAYKCTLNGEVTGRNSKRIYLVKSHENIDRKVYMRLSKMDTTYDGLTDGGKVVKKEQDSLDMGKINWRYAYINSNLTMLSYYLLYKDTYDAKRNKKVLGPAKAAYPKFAALYSGHPYTQIVANLINGYNKLSPGQPLIDFNLPDIAGNLHSLKVLAFLIMKIARALIYLICS